MAELTLSRFLNKLKIQQTPALTWHGDVGERIELSGKVLDNWVAKSANFLCEEFEVDVEDALVLPPSSHWRTVALVVAALRVGATIYPPAQAPSEVQAAFGFCPQQCESIDAEFTGLISSEALAMRYMGELPADLGAIDYTQEVRSHADIYMGTSQPEATTPAFSKFTHGELMTRVLKYSEELKNKVATGVQALEVKASPASFEGTAQFLATMHAGYTAVILDNRFDFEISQRREKIYAEERAQAFPAD